MVVLRNIFRPVAYRVMLNVLNFPKPNFSKFKRHWYFENSANNQYTLMAIASLAFLWPLRKTSKDENTKETPSILEHADNLFDNGHYEECHQLLEDHKGEGDIEIQWRLVRVLYNMSKETKYEKSYKKELVFNAFDIISQLIKNNQEHYAVHKWYAIVLDAKSSLEGIKSRIKELENVKKHMDLAVSLNPKDATVLHMLGEWCYQIADMPWHQRKIAEVLFASPPNSTYEEALDYFLQAETAQPRFYSLNLLRLGNCYHKLDKCDQAKYYLQLAASYPAKSNDDHYANKEAADLLKRL